MKNKYKHTININNTIIMNTALTEKNITRPDNKIKQKTSQNAPKSGTKSQKQRQAI